ncbi:MAG: tetratricopeptide repeat protein [Polyangiaceae bacterium]|nr:tetratricopeptide repeat protein [Polyangiaceae bacterium]
MAEPNKQATNMNRPYRAPRSRRCDRPTPLGAALTLVAALGVAACKTPSAPPRVLPADPVTDGVMPGAGVGDLDRGVAFVTNGAFAEAIPYFDRSIAADPKNAQAHFYRGLCREETKDAAGAEADYKAAIALDATLVEAAVNLGALYLKEPARPAEAIAVLGPAAAKHPEDADLASNLAYAHQLQKEWDKATAAFEQAIRASGSADPAATANLEFRLGAMLVEAERREAATEHLRKALPAFTSDAPTLMTIAHLFGQSRAYADCVKAFDAALAIKADEAEWYIQRGVCKHGAGNEEAARNDYEAALKVEPGNAEAYYALGKSYLLDRKRLNAVSSFEKAVKLGGDGPFAKAAKQELERIAAEQKARGQ